MCGQEQERHASLEPLGRGQQGQQGVESREGEPEVRSSPSRDVAPVVVVVVVLFFFFFFFFFFVFVVVIAAAAECPPSRERQHG